MTSLGPYCGWALGADLLEDPILGSQKVIWSSNSNPGPIPKDFN
jgi:hypothetical protein